MTKKNMRNSLLMLLAVLLCICACAAADGAAVPAEVIRHIQGNWPDYELFDYLCIEDTPKGDYGIALLSREKLSFAPELPMRSDLTAEKVRFTGGRKYAVYTGPGKGYVRSGNGKGAVSTNDWIQVFGEENGWIMIQYDISSDHYRIGWIEAAALPKNAYVKRLDFEPEQAQVCAATDLTDDPLNSRTALKRLDGGTEAAWLATMGEWAYVEVTDGARMRGFVPLDALAVELDDEPEIGQGDAIWPVQAELTMDSVAGKRVMAYVGDWLEGQNRLTLTLWEKERFPSDTLERLKAGTAPMLEGNPYVIESLEWTGDSCWINDGDLLVSRETDGLCDVTGVNDSCFWRLVGTDAFEVAGDAVFLDGIVPETGEPLDEPTVHTFAQFLQIQAKAGWGTAGFDSRNVWVTLNEDGEIACIERFYVPWQ